MLINIWIKSEDLGDPHPDVIKFIQDPKKLYDIELNATVQNVFNLYKDFASKNDMSQIPIEQIERFDQVKLKNWYVLLLSETRVNIVLFPSIRDWFERTGLIQIVS